MNKTNKILRHYKIRIESVYERKKSKYCERLVILIDKMNIIRMKTMQYGAYYVSLCQV